MMPAEVVASAISVWAGAQGGCRYASDHDCDACGRRHRVLQPVGCFGSTGERRGHRRRRGCWSNDRENAALPELFPASPRPLLHLRSLRTYGSVRRNQLAPTFAGEPRASATELWHRRPLKRASQPAVSSYFAVPFVAREAGRHFSQTTLRRWRWDPVRTLDDLLRTGSGGILMSTRAISRYP